MATLTTQSGSPVPPRSAGFAAKADGLVMTPGVWGGTQGSDGSGRRSTHFLPLGARLEGPPGSTPTRFRGGGDMARTTGGCGDSEGRCQGHLGKGSPNRV